MIWINNHGLKCNHQVVAFPIIFENASITKASITKGHYYEFLHNVWSSKDQMYHGTG